MTIDAVATDSANLPEGVEFPPLEMVKYRIYKANDRYIGNFEY